MNKTKFIVVFSLLLLSAVSHAAVVWDGTSTAWTKGSGTEADPYLIETPKHLAYLAAQVNAGITYAGKYFKQTEDFDLNNRTWTMVGSGTSSSYKSFNGIYDGGGREIRNCSAVSVFQYVKNATIRNMMLNGVAGCAIYAYGNCYFYNIKHYGAAIELFQYDYITDSYLGNTYSFCCGGIVCQNKGISEFVKCSNACDISFPTKTLSSIYRLNAYAGGIVGIGSSSAAETIIKECSNTGNIAITYSASCTYKTCQAGGLVGSSSKGSINRSYSLANISVYLDGNVPTGGSYSASALGLGTSTIISNSYARGKISSYGKCYTSGLNVALSNSIGLGSSNQMEYCYYEGTLSAGGQYANPKQFVNSGDVSAWNNYYHTESQLTSTKSGVESRSNLFMKSTKVVNLLNEEDEVFVVYGGINDGYPIFKWQLEGMTLYKLRATCQEVQGTVSGSGEYPENANITIKAIPKEGFVFTGWSDGNTDNPRAVTVTSDATYVAQFSQSAYTIYVNQDCTTSVE